jgi:hypothetical protein
MACMALVAFAAMALPAIASASPVLTSEGKTVPVGTSIFGTNTGETLFEGGFNVKCTHAILTGSVSTNNGSEIAGEIPAGNASFTGTGSGGDCTSALGDTHPTVNSALCMESLSGTDTVEVTGCGANVTFTLTVTGAATCKYSTSHVIGTFITNATATINLKEQPAKKEEGSFLCPGEGKLTMDFDLHTTGGTLLTVS